MDDTRHAIDVMDVKIAELQIKIDHLVNAKSVLEMLAGGLRPTLVLASPVPPNNFVVQGKPPKKKNFLPVGVSPNSTLEPDAVLDGVSLFLTPNERKLWDILFQAEAGVYVHMDVLERETAVQKPSIYVMLSTIRRKLAQTSYGIETKAGAGYILCHYPAKAES